MARGRKRILFIGGTEKGKSTQIVKLIHASTEPVIIHNQSQQKAYNEFPVISLEQLKTMRSGKYQVQDPDFLSFYKITYNNIRNSKVIAEDTSEYMTATKNMELYPIQIGLRHRGIDWVGVFHALAETPKYVIRQANEIILFKTGDTWEDAKTRIPEDLRDIVKAAFERVNRHPSQFYWERIILMKTGTI